MLETAYHSLILPFKRITVDVVSSKLKRTGAKAGLSAEPGREETLWSGLTWRERAGPHGALEERESQQAEETTGGHVFCFYHRQPRRRLHRNTVALPRYLSRLHSPLIPEQLSDLASRYRER